MRSLRLALASGLVALALAACSSSGSPGWTYVPAPSPTPTPVASVDVSPAPSGGPSASPAASQEPSGPSIALAAANVQFDKATLMAPAGQAFEIVFQNNDAGVLHNVEIKDANGISMFKGEIFSGVDSRTYQVPALPAGSYQFICTVHPNMVGTLTVQ